MGFTTNIVKMFRQIRVDLEDANLQGILWRAEPTERVLDFRLTTVAYVMASAPFLALRTLQQLAVKASRFPLGVTILSRNSYVDDVLAGADDRFLAQEARRQLVELLRAGDFALAMWAASDPSLCPTGGAGGNVLAYGRPRRCPGFGMAPWVRHALTPSDGAAGRDCHHKASRAFHCGSTLRSSVGWMAPTLIYAKIFLQDLWLAGCEWDDPLSAILAESWTHFVDSLPDLDEAATMDLFRLSGLGGGTARFFGCVRENLRGGRLLEGDERGRRDSPDGPYKTCAY